MKKHSIFPVILISSLFLVACGKKEQETEPIKTDKIELPEKEHSTSPNKANAKKTDNSKKNEKTTTSTEQNNKTKASTNTNKSNAISTEQKDESDYADKPVHIDTLSEEIEATPSSQTTSPTNNNNIIESPQNDWEQENNTTLEIAPTETIHSAEYDSHSASETMPYYGENEEVDTQMSEYHVPYDVETNQYLEVPMDESSVSFRQAWINDQIEWAKEKGYDTQSFSD
ncbi:hypothetical protein [Vagococcus intermedius]|uniref:Lipoprotein n=1 Tax=Vagococcus intermedius TaxID=2991418 RepID=A0AAF0I8E4_9ENTE|nr:hypothetical protein [Vagococcus intermedius]WEG72452.1 hypothetical protein OL234_05555 [Vagococcus intermedius]WEG74539.1 hypothetical protein OL235_05560 [Vagococcus intermedius]